ncbi:MAG TPA: helix-turn-helix domain-containing protein [Solirubrobacteraceae bacterium]|nr:helix-turn-helix domain-containing protein [Solirubrobacteraceae bacterium]
MAQRLLRAERKERTKTELVEAARTVFLRRGFHGASLDEIAEEAGYTKGAVYSNFDGKDALFLAAFEEHFRRRAEAYADVIFDQEDIEDSYRVVGRFWREANERDPEWARLLNEFLIHASRDEALRRAVHEVRERGLERIAEIVDALAAQHGVEFTMPTVDIARGSGALNRGLAIEQLINPELSGEMFEEMHLAYMRGMTKRSNGRPIKKGQP